jgi:Tol biopolymer transport system component
MDFGYAPANAGWTKSDRAILTWSPDSRKIATFQHDGRGTSEMYLVSTNVGAPRLSAWKYPLPGDSVIFRISRVVIDIDAPGGPKVVRFQMPPDQHRSTVSDHIACAGGTICDVQWYPDGSSVAFVSSSRDHKHAWMRVANAATGEVRTLFEESMQTQVGDASLNENLWRVVPASNELIWWSQKENWLHLYLYDLTTGQLKNRITSGEGNVDDIVRVDESSTSSAAARRRDAIHTSCISTAWASTEGTSACCRRKTPTTRSRCLRTPGTSWTRTRRSPRRP